LKQARRAWYGRIDSFLTSLGFTKSKADSNLYFKVMNDEPVILLLYVDELFLTGEEKLITECKKRHVGMQVHEYTHGNEVEAAGRYFVIID
jgi:hypothetical protein